MNEYFELTLVTKEELDKGADDGNGILYGEGGRKLLKCLRRFKTVPSPEEMTDFRSFLESQDFGDWGWTKYDRIIWNMDCEGFFAAGRLSFCDGDGLVPVAMPRALEIIGGKAFEGCETLLCAKLPQSVRILGDDAFSGCTGLIRIELPRGLETIGNGAFSRCESLETAALPEGTVSIGNAAFYGCRNLESIELPGTLRSIGRRAFCDCDKLQSVHLTVGSGADPEKTEKELANLLPPRLRDKIILKEV